MAIDPIGKMTVDEKTVKFTSDIRERNTTSTPRVARSRHGSVEVRVSDPVTREERFSKRRLFP
jgi:hypothetical protein